MDGDTDVDMYQQRVRDDRAAEVGKETQARDVEAARTAANGVQKRLTLTFKDVTVRVTASGAMLGETLFSRYDPRVMFSRDKGEQRVSQRGRGKKRAKRGPKEERAKRGPKTKMLTV